MFRRFSFGGDRIEQEFVEFLNARRRTVGNDVASVVGEIVASVRARGGEAVRDYTRQFDRLEIDAISLSNVALDLERAAEACPTDVRRAIDVARTRIASYHEQTRPVGGALPTMDGVALSWRWTPVDAAGIYVPGGRASYPSSVLMNAVAAQAAGVKRIVMVSPAPGGELNSAVAYAAIVCGISEFYPIGGAQSIAALAYGAGDLKPVHKIVGPGNAYVAAAKRIVFGDVGIDSIAGPSELTVVADGDANPSWIAADLLSQAEHDPLAQSILISDSETLLVAVEHYVGLHLAELATRSVAARSIDSFGALVHAPMRAASGIVDLIAPEHVELIGLGAEAIANDIRHAGAIFVGPYSTEALGDYATGSNHVLPTSGAARFASGLSTMDFMKRTSIQAVSRAGFDLLAEPVKTLAIAEGLPAHALSVQVRRAE